MLLNRSHEVVDAMRQKLTFKAFLNLISEGIHYACVQQSPLCEPPSSISRFAPVLREQQATPKNYGAFAIHIFG